MRKRFNNGFPSSTTVGALTRTANSFVFRRIGRKWVKKIYPFRKRIKKEELEVD
jgi:hypothetical protein